MGADLQYTMGLDASKFAAGANTAKGTTTDLKSAFGNLAGVAPEVSSMLSGIMGKVAKYGPYAAVAAGAIYGLKKAWEAFSYTAGKGEALAAIAARIGETPERALRLGKAFKAAGLDAGSAAPLLNIMQRSIAGMSESGEPAKKIFDQIGLSVESLLAMSPADQFQKIASTIASIQNPAQRADAAMKIFGRSGGELLRLFNKPEAIAAFSGELSRQQKLLIDNAGRFEQNAINLRKFQENAKGAFGFKMGFMSEFKWFDAVVEKLGKFDWSAIGQTIGKNLNDMISLAFLWKNQLKLGFLEAYNLGLELFQKVGLFKGAVPFDTKELEGKIEGLRASIGGPIKEPSGESPNAGGAGNNPARGVGGKAVKINADNITKVGGFVGGDYGRTQDPVVALEKKVEENTRKIALISQRSLDAFLNMQNYLSTLRVNAAVFAQ